MVSGSQITTVSAVPTDSTLLFHIQNAQTNEKKEAILSRVTGEVRAWLNYCQHLTHIRLDKGSGAEIRGEELVCTNHGAYFTLENGFCTYGPCEGAYLAELSITIDNGDVFLDEPHYEYIGIGPLCPDKTDLTSTSNIEF
jgi:nitrite reductase/ring-hydroxylating ferredoxin subunit